MSTFNISGPTIILYFNKPEEEKQECKRCRENKPLSSFRMFRNKRNGTCTNCLDIKDPKCQHGITIRFCIECDGRSFCKHKIYKTRCSECGGGSLCEHNIRREKCEVCNPNYLCPHSKRSYQCMPCKPLSSLRNAVYRRIMHSLGGEYASKWQELLGCSLEEYKTYIESNFEPWMNLDNYGLGNDKWDIDHTIPIDFENPTLAIKIGRFHFSNTKPMRSSENAGKRNHYAEE